MRTQEATAFEREYEVSEKGMNVSVILKPKRVRGGQGSNIRQAIPGGVTYTKITHKMAAAQERREIWKSKRTWMGRQQGWVLLEDDCEDSIPDDPERTHILGGFVHGDAVCADECWCKDSVSDSDALPHLDESGRELSSIMAGEEE